VVFYFEEDLLFFTSFALSSAGLAATALWFAVSFSLCSRSRVALSRPWLVDEVLFLEAPLLSSDFEEYYCLLKIDSCYLKP
jgi:hypothetical protein